MMNLVATNCLTRKYNFRCASLLALVAGGLQNGIAADMGETRVARWKDDRTAAFEMLFDDSCHLAKLAGI